MRYGVFRRMPHEKWSPWDEKEWTASASQAIWMLPETRGQRAFPLDKPQYWKG
jgi:hypothetical protein